jgi:hypothetical protein
MAEDESAKKKKPRTPRSRSTAVARLEYYRKRLFKDHEKSGTTWISPEGKVFPFGEWRQHDAVAKSILKMLPNPSCSAEAVAAGKGAMYSDWEACEPNELLKRGWVRQRGCEFTVWNDDKRQLENVWLGSVRQKCGLPLRDRINVFVGMDSGAWRGGALCFGTPQEILEYNEGLRGLRRRRRAASKGKKRSR